MIRNLTKEEYQSEKIRIITLMFEPYSNQNGEEYTTGQPVSRDKIKNRIDFQILKNYVPRGADIQSDIYQNLFINLLTINEKNTKAFVDKYYQNPNSAYHFAFYLLKIKAFGVDKKYPNKPSSEGKKMMYASSFDMFNTEFSYRTDEDFEGNNIWFENEDVVEAVDDG